MDQPYIYVLFVYSSKLFHCMKRDKQALSYLANFGLV
jgi:hypothetical protein